jgi:hypothetical protein
VDVHQVRIVDRDPTELHRVTAVDFASVDGVRDRNDSAFLAGYVRLIVEDPPVERRGIRDVHVRIVPVNRDRRRVGRHSASMIEDRQSAGVRRRLRTSAEPWRSATKAVPGTVALTGHFGVR